MEALALSGEEMLAWNERTALSWKKLAEAHPEMLLLPCDIYGVRTVGQLLQHIVAVELRYAQRLAGTAETPYEAIGSDTAEQLFSAHEAAMTGLRVEIAKGGDWDRPLEFQTLTMGRVRASRKSILVHALMHSIRHYAQLATLVRPHDLKTEVPMDYLFMGAERVG